MTQAVPDQRRSPGRRQAVHTHPTGHGPARTVLYLLALLTAAGAAAIPGDQERAALLIRQGRDLLGQPAEARRYAERALEFVEDDPDARAPLGQVAAAEGRWDIAARELDLALERGELRAYEAEQVRTLLAASLIRMRRPEDALQALGPLRPGSGAEALILGARASRTLGRTDTARELLLEASRMYPDRADAWAELASLERSLDRFAQSRAALEAGRSHLPQDASLLLALVSEEWTPADRARRLEDYLRAPERPAALDATAAVLGVRDDPDRGETYLDLFLRADGLRYGGQLHALRAGLADNPELSAKLREAETAWSGDRHLDADADGFPEYRYTVEAGRLASLGADPDQDGMEEVAVEMGQEGEARRVVLGDLGDPAQPEALLTLDYGVYPWVVRARFSRPAYIRVYDLVPMTYRLRVTEGAPSDTSRLAEGFRPPRENEIRALARVYRDYRPADETLVAAATLRDGSLLRVEADADGDGVREHVVRYVDGHPDRGERDLDTNGVFETQEYYTEGVLERIEIDTDGDGRADYVRRPGEPGVESWDLDADGDLDVEHTTVVLSQLRRLYGSLARSGTP